MTHAGDGPRSEPQLHLHQQDQTLEGGKITVQVSKLQDEGDYT